MTRHPHQNLPEIYHRLDIAISKKDYSEAWELSLYLLFSPKYDFFTSLEKTKEVFKTNNYPKVYAGIKKVLENPNEPDLLFDLGKIFVEIYHPEIASACFKKVLDRDLKHLSEILNIALEYQKNKEYLYALFIRSSFSGYIDFEDGLNYNKLKLFCQKTEGVLDWVKQTKKDLQDSKNSTEYNLVLDIEKIAIRLLDLPSPNPHIRDWYYLLYGAIVLQYQGYAGESSARHLAGRFGHAFTSPDMLKEIIVCLKKILNEYNIKINRIRFFPDRDSEILANICSLEMGLSVLPFKNKLSSKELLIVSDSKNLNLSTDLLSEIKPDQIIFCLNFNHNMSGFICPDIIGFESLGYDLPWHERFNYNKKLGPISMLKADNRGVKIIAQEIFDSKYNISPYFPNLLDFYHSKKEYLALNFNKPKTMRKRAMILSELPV